MHYHWSDCPRCGCQLSINYSVSAGGASGSVRRWSSDRSINDGRPFQVAAADRDATGGFTTPCVCGQEISVVSQAEGGDRDAGLRVTLTED